MPVRGSAGTVLSQSLRHEKCVARRTTVQPERDVHSCLEKTSRHRRLREKSSRAHHPALQCSRRTAASEAANTRGPVHKLRVREPYGPICNVWRLPANPPDLHYPSATRLISSSPASARLRCEALLAEDA